MAANLLLCLADWLFVDGYFICTLKCHSGLHSLWNLTTPSVLCFVQGLMTHEDAGTNLDACPFNRTKSELAHQALCEVSLIEMHWCRRLFSNLLLEKIIFMSFWSDLFIMCTSPSRSELRAVCSLTHYWHCQSNIQVSLYRASSILLPPLVFPSTTKIWLIHCWRLESTWPCTTQDSCTRFMSIFVQ